MELPSIADLGPRRAAAVAAILILSALGIDRFGRPPASDGLARPVLKSPEMPQGPARPLARGAPASAEFEQLLELFREAEAAPGATGAARAFKEEFQETPALQGAWEEFEKQESEPEPNGTVREFVERLTERAEFRQLVSRFAQDPGFRSVVSHLSAKPEFREIVQAALAKTRASARSRSGRTLGLTRVNAARPGLGGSPGWDEGSVGRPDGAAARSGAAQPLADIPGARAGSGTRDRPGSGPADRQGGAHAVSPRLASIGPAGPDDGDVRNFCRLPAYAGFCAGDPPRLKPEFRAIEGLIPRYGLWGACFRAKLYRRCVEVCTGTCRPAEPWTACLEAHSSDTRCLAACQEQEPPCYVPERVLDQYCRPRAAACEKASVRAAKAAIPPECGTQGEVRLPQPCACSPGTCPSECGVTMSCSCTGPGCPTTTAAPRAPQSLRPSFWLGYNLGPDGKLVVGPKQRDTIQTMYDLFIKTKGNAALVAKRLNAQGQDKKDHGGRIVEDFTADAVRAMIQRCAYGGSWGERLRIVDDHTFKQAQRLITGDKTQALGCKGGPGGPTSNR